jgi:beta-lactamase class A
MSITVRSHSPIVIIALLLLHVTVAAQSTVDSSSTLDARIKRELSSFKGNVSIFAKNLETGETYNLRGDERVPTASTIKIAVMVETFARVAEGKARWTDEVILEKQKKVGGSGILQELSDGLHLTLRDAVNLMMLLSDNTATNLVLDVVTTDAVNARMESLGFKNIKILRKVFGGGDSLANKDPENKKYGLGFATSREMVLLMEKLERGEIISAAASKEMIDLMKREQARYAIGRSQSELSLASKYGALDHLRSCIGILYTKKGRIAMAITVNDMPNVQWSVDNPAYLLISRLSVLIADGMS